MLQKLLNITFYFIIMAMQKSKNNHQTKDSKDTVMEFSFKFPPHITSLDNLLMVILYIRKYNKQKNTTFKSLSDQKEGMIGFNIRHKTPPILKKLLHIDLEEQIDTSNIDKSIFGTGKFFKEQSMNDKQNIYKEIEEAIDKAPETEK